MSDKENKRLPWYDSEWLTYYLKARDILETHNPSKVGLFTDTFEPLRTRSDFKVIDVPDALDVDTIEKSKEIITNLRADEKEVHEVFNMGRLVVHNHSFFNELHRSLTDMVSERVGEEVEPTYNFLSLYQSMGGCDVHMDAPSAKWTFDICIEQSYDWEIFIGETQGWAEDFDYQGEDWSERIKKDPANKFKPYSLKSGSGIIFSGNSAWHYRNPIHRENQNDFCNLIFFHFTPKGMNEVINPKKWAELFDTQEINQIFSK